MFEGSRTLACVPPRPLIRHQALNFRRQVRTLAALSSLRVSFAGLLSTMCSTVASVLIDLIAFGSPNRGYFSFRLSAPSSFWFYGAVLIPLLTPSLFSSRRAN